MGWAGLGWVGAGASAILSDARTVFRDGLSNPTAADGLTPACACLVQDQGCHHCLSACKCVGIECKAQQSCAVPSTCCKVRSHWATEQQPFGTAPSKRQTAIHAACWPTHPSPSPYPRQPSTAGPTHGRCAVEVRERKGKRDPCSHNPPLTPPTNAAGSAPTDRLPVLLPRRARGAPLRQRGPVPMRAALSLLHRQAGAGRRLPPPALPRPPPGRD